MAIQVKHLMHAINCASVFVFFISRFFDKHVYILFVYQFFNFHKNDKDKL